MLPGIFCICTQTKYTFRGICNLKCSKGKQITNLLERIRLQEKEHVPGDL